MFVNFPDGASPLLPLTQHFRLLEEFVFQWQQFRLTL